MTDIINATVMTSHPFNYDMHSERLKQGNGNLYVAFMSDTHIGYRAYKHVNRHLLNLRELDGETALAECVRSIVANPKVSTVIHGGDFFHTSTPTARQIKVVMTALDMFAKAGIKVFGQAGNHDVPDVKNELTAVALLNDEARHSYALWKPYQVYEIHDGVYLHAVSHHGLRGDDAPKITPIPGGINLFSTHGAALDPANHTLMQCAEAPREQFIPAEMIIDDNFNAKLLGHYHNRYPIGQGKFNAWYAGSTVRRGFSDEEGGRGWMLFEIKPDGSIDVENHNIFQRPQYDFDTIDASGMSANDLETLIKENIESTGVDLSAFDEKNAPIVRQKVINASRPLRKALDRRLLNEMTKNMLSWDLKMSQPEVIKRTVEKDGEIIEVVENGEAHDHGTPSLTQERGAGGAVEFFDSWVDNSATLSNIPEKDRPEVKDTARHHLSTAENMKGK